MEQRGRILLWSGFYFTLALAPIPVVSQAEPVFTVVPESSAGVVMEAYRTLPARLRDALATSTIDVTFTANLRANGAAMGADAFGQALPIAGALVQWPSGADTVTFPWGRITRLQATRHELAHVALERLFAADSAAWVNLLPALRREGPAFLAAVQRGHWGAADLYSRSTIAAYGALHEYLASLVEHCGAPVRMPLPRDRRTRRVVELLVSGRDCAVPRGVGDGGAGMSDEEALGHIGAMHARWRALVNVLIEKGLVTQDEILAAVEREATAQREREDELDEEAEEETEEEGGESS